MFHFAFDLWQQKDWLSAILLVAILLAALWCCSLPICETTQHAYLRRFHLRSANFPTWAIQQLTPAMYNLENTYWFSEDPLSQTERQQTGERYFVNLEGRTIEDSGSISLPNHSVVYLDRINHFPTRTMTFVGARGSEEERREGYFYFQSRYRDQTLETTFRVEPSGLGHSAVTRLSPVQELD